MTSSAQQILDDVRSRALALDSKQPEGGHWVTVDGGTENAHPLFIKDGGGFVPLHLRADAGELKRFSKAAIERKLIQHHEEYGGGHTAHADSQLANFVNPFKFRGVKGKLPEEIANHLDKHSSERHLFEIAKPGETAQGEDAMGEHGAQRYLDIARGMSEGRLAGAKAFAEKSPDPEMQFLNSIHSNMPAAKDRAKQVPLKASELRVGSAFKVHGHEFRVAEDEHGMKVLQAGHDYGDTPLDALTTVPADEGSYRPGKRAKAPKPDAIPFSAELPAYGDVEIPGGQIVRIPLNPLVG